MMRVRRNCSTLEDYKIKSGVLKDRFLEKGYKKQHLDAVVEEIRMVPREECLKEGTSGSMNMEHEWAFISSFHSQFRKHF